jgi:hypothetical protein
MRKNKTLKTLVAPNGDFVRVEHSDVLAFLEQGYTIPTKLALLFKNGKKREIKLENYALGLSKVISSLKDGYSFERSAKPMLDLPMNGVQMKEPPKDFGWLYNQVSGYFSDYDKQITAPLNDKIAELEKKLEEKDMEMEVFRQLSQINIEKSKKIQEENASLKEKTAVAFNVVTQQLLDIIANNPMEEIILNQSGDRYTFTVQVKK